MEKKTPLYQTHVDMGGKIVEFGGFLMPVQYPTGVIAEHMAVREKAGLFDVSHMGELRLKGPDAVANVQKIITADISNMKDGEIKYSMFCNDNGGIIDDFIVYRCAADNYWLVVNAGNREKDAAWVESHLSGDVDYRDEGNDWGQIALQGPKSGDILKKLCDEQYIPAKYYTFTEDVPLNLGERTIRALVSQTGYTGEYGFEIYCKAEDTVDLWKALLKAGEPEGLIPCGLGARDTLRLRGFDAALRPRDERRDHAEDGGTSVQAHGQGLHRPRRACRARRAENEAHWHEGRRPRHRARALRPLHDGRRKDRLGILRHVRALSSAAASRWAISPPKISRSASTSTPTCAAAWSSSRSCQCRSTSSNAEIEIFDRIFGNHLTVNYKQHSLRTILRRKLP